MSDGETVSVLVIDGIDVRFTTDGERRYRVDAGASHQTAIGTVELASDRASFLARRPDGEALTRPSPWGGPVTARFGSRELAARALLDEGPATRTSGREE